ncbi:MAG TPA: hypothetical protein QF353_06740 [Gammaproteobacteria bacterium]|nr:hypothetical protein [Gammaproteobacteria bacterium]
MNLSLDNIRGCFDRLELMAPQASVITIAGTNGKGTCAAILESLGKQSGYKVGVFTSPHLHDVTERIRIDQVNISEAKLYGYLKTIQNKMGEGSLSYFEILACAALMAFAEAGCDLLILEAGLGGRLDAMNALDFSKTKQYISVITSIGLDHQAWLGYTRTAIMQEKLGYSREGFPLVLGEMMMPEKGEALLTKTKAKCYRIVKDFFIENNEWGVKGDRTITVPKNKWVESSVACALKAYQLLGGRLSTSLLNKAFQRTLLPGRCEFRKIGSQEWVFDVAHNSESLEMLAKQLNQDKDFRCVIILAMRADKNVFPGLECLGKLSMGWVWVQSIFGSPQESVDKYLQCHPAKVEYLRDVLTTVKQVLNSKADKVLVTGSFLTVQAFQDVCQVQHIKEVRTT